MFGSARGENSSALKYVVFLYIQKIFGIKLFCVCNILQLKFPAILFSDQLKASNERQILTAILTFKMAVEKYGIKARWPKTAISVLAIFDPTSEILQ